MGSTRGSGSDSAPGSTASARSQTDAQIHSLEQLRRDREERARHRGIEVLACAALDERAGRGAAARALVQLRLDRHVDDARGERGGLALERAG